MLPAHFEINLINWEVNDKPMQPASRRIHAASTLLSRTRSPSHILPHFTPLHHRRQSAEFTSLIKPIRKLPLSIKFEPPPQRHYSQQPPSRSHPQRHPPSVLVASVLPPSTHSHTSVQAWIRQGTSPAFNGLVGAIRWGV